MTFDTLDSIMQKNELFLTICAEYLNKYETLVTEEVINEITGADKAYDEISFASFLSSAFIENDILEREMLREYFIPSVKKLNPNDYKNNPYYKNIKISDKKIGNWTLGHQKYAKYEGFVRDDYQIFDSFREVASIGFFDEEFSFPTVFENGVEWMAIKPNEIETMKEPIDKAHGKIAVFGLGLGYFAYMTSLKSNVTEITVIERDENIIRIFEESILPFFENKDKIKIVRADAFSYVENEMKNENFDFAFVDLWHDVSDGTELYVRMKKLEKLHEKTEFSYWIEKSILLTIRKALFRAISKKKIEGKNHLSDEEIIKNLDLKNIKEHLK